jgi:hypothetical protein
MRIDQSAAVEIAVDELEAAQAREETPSRNRSSPLNMREVNSRNSVRFRIEAPC